MKTTFQKMTAAFGILAIALFLAVTASAQCGSYDQPKLKHQSWLTNGQSGLLKLIDRPDDDDGIVGFWRVTLTSKGNTGLGIPDGAQLDHGFAQWHSDGTEIMNSNRQPNTGSFCLGVWKKVGPGTYQLNHFAMGFDDTIHQSYTNIREDVSLSHDGDSFAGTFVITNFDLQGNATTPPITGEIVGKRVKTSTTIGDVL